MSSTGSRWYRVAPVVLVLALLTAACTQTTIAGLSVHTAPTLGSPVVDDIPKSGTPVRVQCWTRGDVVENDDVWYRIAAPGISRRRSAR